MQGYKDTFPQGNPFQHQLTPAVPEGTVAEHTVDDLTRLGPQPDELLMFCPCCLYTIEWNTIDLKCTWNSSVALSHLNANISPIIKRLARAQPKR